MHSPYIICSLLFAVCLSGCALYTVPKGEVILTGRYYSLHGDFNGETIVIKDALDADYQMWTDLGDAPYPYNRFVPFTYSYDDVDGLLYFESEELKPFRRHLIVGVGNQFLLTDDAYKLLKSNHRLPSEGVLKRKKTSKPSKKGKTEPN